MILSFKDSFREARTRSESRMLEEKTKRESIKSAEFLIACLMEVGSWRVELRRNAV